jgi:DNA polymerase III delta subunit
MKKLWWIDNSDPIAAKACIEDVKANQCQGWDWYQFNNEAYSGVTEAAKQLMDAICIPPLFSIGKIVFCRGLPLETGVGSAQMKTVREWQAKVAKQLSSIPDNVLFIIIARPDKTHVLYKEFKALEGKNPDFVRIDERLELTDKNAVDWIQMKARGMGLEIDKQASEMLADITSFNPSAICMELQKLKHVAENRQISTRLIGMTCDGAGAANIFKLSEHILTDRAVEAHELLQRLLDAGEPPLKICGLLQDSVQKMAIAQSCNGNLDQIKAALAEAKKWEKQDGDKPKRERVRSDKWGYFVRTEGESVPLYANLNAFFYSCKYIGRKRPGWAYDALKKMAELQIRLRQKEYNEASQMHLYLSVIMKEDPNA